MSTETVPRISAAASLRAGAKVAAILLASAVAMPLQAIVLRVTRGPPSFVLPRWWHRALCRLLGIAVAPVGMPRAGGRMVFVGNHISHFDILVLGGLLRARFIAKDDMARWPGMRFIGGLQQTVFISRRVRDAADVADAVAGAMRRGHDLVLFAEGTTSPGVAVAPFKSSLFSLFVGDNPVQGAAPWTLQPFTLDLRAVDGRALDAGGDRDGYAWHGTMDAGAHVRRFLRLSGAHVRVVFHAPITVVPGMDRKTLAALVHAVVASALPPPAAAPAAAIAFTAGNRQA